MAYLLDANVFIQAKKMHYGFDICPAFWDWLDRENGAGRVVSIDKVREEFAPAGDELVDWAKPRAASMFPSVGEESLSPLSRVSEWIRGRSYSEAAINTFLQEADYYLVGRALAATDIVVTHELPAPGSKHNIKIPDVCLGIGVQFMNPFAMLRTERASFVLAQ